MEVEGGGGVVVSDLCVFIFIKQHNLEFAYFAELTKMSSYSYMMSSFHGVDWGFGLPVYSTLVHFGYMYNHV